MKIKDNKLKEIAKIMLEKNQEELNTTEELQHVFSNGFYEKMEKLFVLEREVKNNNKYWLVATFATIVLIVILVLNFPIHGQYRIVTAIEVDYNMTQLSRLKNTQVTNSNPFAFKDNENYKQIVELGVPAFNTLIEKYEKRELGGFDAYIAACAIEEICDIHITEIRGEEWNSGEEFWEMWNKTISELPKTFQNISESQMTVDEKINQIREWGVMGEYYLMLIQKSDDAEIVFYKQRINVKEIKEELKESYTISEKDYISIEKYLKKSLN